MINHKLNDIDNKEKLKYALYYNGYIPKEIKDKIITQMDERKKILSESYVYYI